MKKILGLLLCAVCACGLFACGGEGSSDDTYTYNSALTTFPTNWNPHAYQTSTDSTILDYTSMGFYEFDYNENKDGYRIVPAMAVGEPIDVTADYAGEDSKWGIPAGATSRAWKINLNKNLRWQDGTPITAQSFVNSAKLLLNPEASNYRADTLYQGSFTIANAKSYQYQGQTIYITDAASDPSQPDSNIYVDLSGLVYFFGSVNSPRVYYENGYKDYFMVDGVDIFQKYQKRAVVTEEVKAELNAVAAAFGDNNPLAYREFCFIQEEMPAVDFEDVGLKVGDDGSLIMILEKELSGFYLLYTLTSTWLVNEELYKKCESVKDGVYTNSYGTSVDTFMSYGPYKLTFFQQDKEMHFDKNEEWFGYDLKENKNRYQTTNISFKLIGEAATRLQEFNSGNLDIYGLSADDMETYSMSDYIYYTTGDSTFFIALNPDFEALKTNQKAGENKTILTLKEFRMALSFAVDRAAFALATSPTNSPALAMFSDIIISDPETGTAYRTTDQAKKAVVDFWGLTNEIGEGKKYATMDEAIESITGYDLAGAKALFDEAYDAAIAAGLMTATDKVNIKIGLPNGTSQFYSKGYDYLVNAYTAAVTGTKLEGKLIFEKDDTLGNDFSDALKNNKVDLLFGVGWTGAALDPYGLVSAYTDPEYQYDDSFDTSKAMLTITLDGKNLCLSLYDWTVHVLAGEACDAAIMTADGTDSGEVFSINAGTDAENELRLNILAAVEKELLTQYTMIPLIDDASAALKGMQIKYYTEEYIYGVGRGGVKYMTYNFTDAEWYDYVKSQNGQLKYN